MRKTFIIQDQLVKVAARRLPSDMVVHLLFAPLFAGNGIGDGLGGGLGAKVHFSVSDFESLSIHGADRDAE